MLSDLNTFLNTVKTKSSVVIIKLSDVMMIRSSTMVMIRVSNVVMIRCSNVGVIRVYSYVNVTRNALAWLGMCHADVARDMFACMTRWHGWGQIVSEIKQIKNKKPQRRTCWPTYGSADVNVTRDAFASLRAC